MPSTWRINIRPNPHPPGPAIFEFEQPPKIEVGDQIFWSNADTLAHFPEPDPPTTYGFVTNQIAAQSTSPGFAPSTPGTINYHCKLHPAETGTIPVLWRINIRPNPHPPGPAIFEFEQPPKIEVGDQIFWSNADTLAHFPEPGSPTTYGFMTNQIAAQSTSPGFAPSTPGTINYHCSLHPAETGTITVFTSPPAQQRGQTNATV